MIGAIRQMINSPLKKFQQIRNFATKENTKIIVVGSTNLVKIQAVKEVLLAYPTFVSSRILSHAAPSGISEQPMSLEETIQGAKNRAKGAFQVNPDCHYSFGIESGLIEAKGSSTGFIETSICCIHDGKNYHLGMSCGFEVPRKILDFVLRHKMDLSQACHAAEVTANPKLGSEEGLIGVLTKGRIVRKDYTKQSVITALAQLENESLYQG